MNTITKYILNQVAAKQLSHEEAKLMLMELQNLEAAATEAPGAAKTAAPPPEPAGATKMAKADSSEMAIIGMAGKFPKAADLEEYWTHLKQGDNCIDHFPESRLQDYRDQCAQSAYARIMTDFSPAEAGGEVKADDLYVKGGFLAELDKFDAAFFRIPPREAMFMDPLQRVFLETAFTAMEDAGYGGKKLQDAKVGVFVGKDHTTPTMYRYLTEPDPLHWTGSWTGILASRISYIYNWRGPSMVIDTACSSGLVAIHEACRALYHQECDLALAGGIHLQLFPTKKGSNLVMEGVESADGRVRTFDKYAGGTVWGEGAGVVVLKPLLKALADGDQVYAVIKGSAINNDGASNGITAPNAQAQKEVILRAWNEADIHPETLSYIEAHGTGTILGDPIELKGLSDAFAEHTMKKQFCAIGSVKTNVGHLVAASGLASVIKVVLALKNRQLPPSINFSTPNPYINFGNSPVYVNDRLRPWEAEGNTPRRAGVSSFGFSGANCHLVLEEAPRSTGGGIAPLFPGVMTLSAQNLAGLRMLLEKYHKFLDQTTEVDLGNICYTANTGRGHYLFRLAFMARDLDDLKGKIGRFRMADFNTVREPGVYTGAGDELTETERRRLSILAAQKVQEYVALTGSQKGDFPEPMARSQELAELPQQPTGPPQELMGLPQKLLGDICRLYVQGADIDWDEIYRVFNFRKVSLPPYPLERIKFWAEPNRVLNEGWSLLPQKPQTALQKQKAAFLKSDYRKNGSAPAIRQMSAQTQSAVEYVAPRNDIEKKLALLWEEVLEVEGVGIHDNFFELGGHSLKAFQLIEKANQRNLQLSITDIFTANTIAGMAALIHQAPQGDDVSMAYEGEIPLIPVQSCFWERQFPEPYHWNLSVMSYSREGFDAAILRRILTKIVEHHDALRMAFRKTGAGITQFIRGLDQTLFDLEVLDLTQPGKERPEVERQIELAAARIQGSIDLEQGPLVKAGLFKTEAGDHLLLTVHHLVLDGESLGILLEDLRTGYIQAVSGLEIQLPKKTGSFQEWARRLQEYGKSDQILGELDYWRKIDETMAPSLPKDHLVTDHRFQFSKIIKMTFPAEDSARLLQPKPEGLSIQETLLISFGIALGEWTKAEKALVRVIGNGRDLGLARMNLSRTIGWLSISYPVILAPGCSTDFWEQVRKMRDEIRSVPGNGAGYDILRYITLPLKKTIPPLNAKPEIIFNFLGMVDDIDGEGDDPLSGRIEVSKIPLGFSKSPESPKEYTLDVNVYIVARRLEVSLDYNRLEYEEATIRNLGELFLRNLKRILELSMDGE